MLDEAELQARRDAFTPREQREIRGYRRMHVEHVLQANHGCDLDFLRGRSGVVEDAVTYL